MWASVLCEIEEEMVGLGEVEAREQMDVEVLEVPEVDKEEVTVVASVEAEVEIEDEGLGVEPVELLKEVELCEHCSSSRIILSSTSP